MFLHPRESFDNVNAGVNRRQVAKRIDALLNNMLDLGGKCAAVFGYS
jgi:hypothetical protein